MDGYACNVVLRNAYFIHNRDWHRWILESILAGIITAGVSTSIFALFTFVRNWSPHCSCHRGQCSYLINRRARFFPFFSYQFVHLALSLGMRHSLLVSHVSKLMCSVKLCTYTGSFRLTIDKSLENFFSEISVDLIESRKKNWYTRVHYSAVTSKNSFSKKNPSSLFISPRIDPSEFWKPHSYTQILRWKGKRKKKKQEKSTKLCHKTNGSKIERLHFGLCFNRASSKLKKKLRQKRPASFWIPYPLFHPPIRWLSEVRVKGNFL